LKTCSPKGTTAESNVVLIVSAVFWWIPPLMIGVHIGERRNRLVAGVVWVLLFGWLGVAVIASYSPKPVDFAAELDDWYTAEEKAQGLV
jgi:hypothetical protein